MPRGKPKSAAAAPPPAPPKFEREPGKYERLCWDRQVNDIKNGSKRGLVFDRSAGERVVQFVEGLCRHHKGEWAGKPLLLEEWQKSLVRICFGWKRADGTRRFRTMYVEIPRKNGKSELAAALGLYLTVADHEEGSEVYASATKKDQAKIVWKAARAMVKRSPELKKFAKNNAQNISVERTDSFFEPLSADSETLDGLNPHGNVVDELHAHKDRGVWEVLDTAMGARRQPMTIAITTAGVYDPESIGWEMHDYAVKVLEGVFEDDSFFAFIAAADPPKKGDEGYYLTERAQAQANPNFGISVKLDYMTKQAEKAKRLPRFFNKYLQLHLNVWTQQLVRWLPLERWNEADPAPPPDVDVRALAIEREAALKGKTCWGGLDLSSKLDLSALVLVFPLEQDAIELVARFWLPEQTVENALKKGQKHYELWAREGWITTTPGDSIDYEFIRDEVNELAKTYALQQLGFDPSGATDLSNRLMSDSIQMVEIGQSYRSISESAKDFEARVVSRKVRHHNNPVLRWCVSNAVVSTDSNGRIKPDKKKAAEKIDGVVAAIMGLGRLIAAPPPEQNPYADRGFRTL